jgi:hypothetical protein
MLFHETVATVAKAGRKRSAGTGNENDFLQVLEKRSSQQKHSVEQPLFASVTSFAQHSFRFFPFNFVTF